MSDRLRTFKNRKWSTDTLQQATNKTYRKYKKKREKEKEKKDGRKKVEHKILTSDSISKLCKFHKQWRFQIEYETSQTTAPTKG